MPDGKDDRNREPKSHRSTSNSLVRWALILVLALLVPIVPFLIFGPAFEAGVRQFLDRADSPWILATLVTAVLATDVFLPVPSSLVSTFAGAKLGIALGTFSSWLGMTLGACGGYALARWLGRPLAVRWSRADDLANMESLVERRGPIVLVVTRALPVLAEAAVLLCGVLQLPWRRFLPAVALAHLGIALAYSCLGRFAQEQDQLLIALVASGVFPLLAAAMARRWLRGTH